MNSQETGTRGGHRPFGLRGWQFLVNHDRAYLAQAAERSIQEAPGFEVTHLEFPNMAMQLPYAYTDSPVPPCANWVLCGQTFRDFPRLARHHDLHSRGAVSTPEDRSRNLAYMKDLFGKVKASGLGVMAWHHVRRDLPDELAQEYPESATGDPGFLQDWEEATLTEFFEVAPEVDMLVVTSLTETPGVLENARPDSPGGSAGRRVRSHGAGLPQGGQDFDHSRLGSRGSESVAGIHFQGGDG